jgi:hypothetical protein
MDFALGVSTGVSFGRKENCFPGFVSVRFTGFSSGAGLSEQPAFSEAITAKPLMKNDLKLIAAPPNVQKKNSA